MPLMNRLTYSVIAGLVAVITILVAIVIATPTEYGSTDMTTPKTPFNAPPNERPVLASATPTPTPTTVEWSTPAPLLR